MASNPPPQGKIQEVQERQKTTLNNIQELQNVEKQLYSNLEASSANDNNALEQQESVIKRINKLSDMRMNLYDQLKTMYSFLQDNVVESRNDLVDQTAVVGIIENELNNAKKKMGAIEDSKYNKLRMVEINTYASKRYDANKKIMKQVILYLVILLLIAILYNADILSSGVASTLSGLVMFIGAVVVVGKIWDVSRRDNMNFDEYNWYFDPSDATGGGQSVWDYNKGQLQHLGDDLGLNKLSASCYDNSCCAEGTTWSDSKQQCVVSGGSANGAVAANQAALGTDDATANGATANGATANGATANGATANRATAKEQFTNLTKGIFDRRDIIEPFQNFNKISTFDVHAKNYASF